MQSEHLEELVEDRRWCARKMIELNVALYYDRLGLLPCKTLDMSMEGMFVYTGRITLPSTAKWMPYSQAMTVRRASSCVCPQKLCASARKGLVSSSTILILIHTIF